MPDEYRISELAEKAGVTKRTIHYYISKGLIPPSDGAGVGSIYREEHLMRVLLVKKLQEQYLPLDRIRQLMSGLNVQQVEQMLSDIGESNVDSDKVNVKASGNNDIVLPYEYSVKKSAVDYLRISLGLGIELHFPSDVYEKNTELIENIEKYAKKLIDER